MFAVTHRDLRRKGRSPLFYPVENLVDNLSFSTGYFDKFVRICDQLTTATDQVSWFMLVFDQTDEWTIIETTRPNPTNKHVQPELI